MPGIMPTWREIDGLGEHIAGSETENQTNKCL